MLNTPQNYNCIHTSSWIAGQGIQECDSSNEILFNQVLTLVERCVHKAIEYPTIHGLFKLFQKSSTAVLPVSSEFSI